MLREQQDEPCPTPAHDPVVAGRDRTEEGIEAREATVHRGGPEENEPAQASSRATEPACDPGPGQAENRVCAGVKSSKCKTILFR